MAKEPVRRYATAADFRDDLRRFLRGEPITARRVGRTERTWRWCRRNPVMAGLSSMALLLLVAVATVSTLAYLRETKHVGEKDALIRDKDGLITEKEGLIQEKDREVIRADTAAEAAQRELYAVKIARAAAYLDANDYQAANESLVSIPRKRRGWEYYQLWRRLEGTTLTLRGHTGAVNSVSFSPDGTRLASASHDQTVKLWDAQTGAELQTLRGHSKDVTSVSFSPDGMRLASASYDQTVKLWDAQTGAELKALRGHTGNVDALSFSPDGTRLATASGDQTVKLWDAETGAELQTLGGGGAVSVSFSPDGIRLATASWDGVKLWDAQSGAELQTLHGHLKQVTSLSFSPDGMRLASASHDGTVKLWTAQTSAELPTLGGHAGTWVSFSPDWMRLAGVSWDGTITLWDAQTDAELKTLGGPIRGGITSIYSLSFSPDGTRLASASWDDTVKLWDAQTGAELQTLRGHSEKVTSVTFGQDGMRLAGASNDGTIKLWDVETGAELQTFRGHSDSVHSVRLSEDATRLVSQDAEEKTLVWKLPDGELLPDEPAPHAANLTDQIAVPLLRVISRGIDIQLIRKNPKYDPWKEDAERRKKLSPKWHADDAAKAEQAENWYAAAFHVAWLMKLNPDDPVFPLRHTRVVKQLTAKGMPLPVICRGIPQVAIPESTVSTMNLTYITRDGEMICYRFSDRSSQPVRSPTGTPRWIGWNSGERCWIALVDKQLQRLPVDETSPSETLWTFEEAPEYLAVSPDGQRLAWLRKNAKNEAPHLMVQRFDDEPLQDLGPGYDPDWSADGQRLTCVTSTDRWHIGVWDGKAMSIRSPLFHDSISVFPAFAPDGKHIAYGGLGPDDTRQIAVMTVEGEQIHLVTRNGRMNLKPAYSPDGRYLAYVRSGPDGDELAFVDLLTEEETVIAGDAAAVRPVWRKVADSP